MRLGCRRTVAIALAIGLLVAGGGPAAAATIKPHWRYVGDAGGVLISPAYVFLSNPVGATGQSEPGGILIDEQNGEKRSIVPPTGPGHSCSASAIGGPWLAFLCVLPAQNYQAPTLQFELYRIGTRQWRSIPDAGGGAVRAVGADWIEFWAAYENVPQRPVM